MNYLDWLVVGFYVVMLITISYYLSKGQETTDDYYLGGRTFRWWQVGLSTMATQLGAVSFISAPAFAGLREGGGLQWLTYEFAVPLAMLFLMLVIFPPLYKSGIVSIYEYLERRFGTSTRLILSIVFQFSRAFAAGITVYAVALILSAVFGIPLWINIIITGIIALIYDYLGGMKAVVISDVIQMAILFVGILVCGWYALDLVGGWQVFASEVSADRLNVVDFSNFGVGDDNEFGFWPMVIGGFFLYTSYYGCDQSQAQRMLSAQDIGQVRKALLFNGMARFPLVVLYCLMGLVIGTLAFSTPSFLEMIPSDRPDYMVPVFIAQYLPHGIIGLLLVAIFSAAMSSLDSALNSLSAATVEDLIIRGKKETISNEKQMKYSKITTIFWGVVCVLLAFAAGNIADTVIEAINKIGSLFYGPVIATFMLAILTSRTRKTGINIGILAGVLCNFLLWIFASDQVFWFWWNFTGFAVTASVGYGFSILFSEETADKIVQVEKVTFRLQESVILTAYFILIILFSLSLMAL
ncbi:MAG: sodium:solute symporter [Balneolaceae bacterium]|nr:sodium:solute symporter [Balneolaceae bacterium]